MGREVRRVPANWQHPTIDKRHDPYGHGGYQPMYDQRIEDAIAEWLTDFDRIRAGQFDEYEECYASASAPLAAWIEDNPAPIPAYYAPWTDDEATWFQLWETVSEGTPVSPPFATVDELAAYLAANGDFWDQKRVQEGRQKGPPGWGIDAARAFVSQGWAPSLAVLGGAVVESKDVPLALSKTA